MQHTGMDEDRRRLKCRVTYANDVLKSANAIAKNGETSDSRNEANEVTVIFLTKSSRGCFFRFRAYFIRRNEI